MVNYTQIMFQNCHVGPLKGVPDKRYLKKLFSCVNGQTSGIHRNEGVRKLGYMSILEQLSVYTTQSGSTTFPVPKNPGATVTYPSGKLTAAVVSATTRSHK